IGLLVALLLSTVGLLSALILIGSGAVGLRSVFRRLAARGSRAGLFTIGFLLIRLVLIRFVLLIRVRFSASLTILPAFFGTLCTLSRVIALRFSVRLAVR